MYKSIFNFNSLCSVIMILKYGLLWIATPVYSQSQCIWYGKCGSLANNPAKSLNCQYNGPAKKASQTTISILKKLCPHYFDREKNTSINTCCDDQQMEEFEKSSQAATGLISKCPSCQINFFEHLCEFTCRPDQSQFMIVKKTNETSSGKNGITEIDLYMSKNYAYSIYQSCKNIFYPMTNSYVMDLFCGRPVLKCSPEIFFNFIGDQSFYSPFQINYLLTDSSINGFSPLSAKTYACNETPTGDTKRCSCLDCPDSCSMDSIKPTNDIFIGNLLLSQLIIILISLIGLNILILYFFTRLCRKRDQNETSPENLDCFSAFFLKMRFKLRKLELLGSKIEETMESSFGNLGKQCASKPWLFIVLVIVIVAILSPGILFLKLTMDPVELWANPNSKTRIYKDYYDQNFGPFYRSEQIILHSVDSSNFMHNSSDGFVEFGPVFTKTFLMKTFELEEIIRNISVDGITIKDLCFAPLSENAVAKIASECSIISVWGYFQDDPSKLDENYLNHLIECLKNPLEPDNCLAPWGGPIIPQVAFGGYLDEELDKSGEAVYTKAKALILTFLLKNYINHTLQIPVMKWESEFIKICQEWSNDQKNIVISYSTTRSIEDELNRVTSTDVVTIVISYVAMFIYIVIFLGHYSNFKRFLIDSKITIAFFGLVLVIMSVLSSLGFFGYVGVPATPIIVEVVPFLVLAIGVDNIFIITQTYDSLSDLPQESITDKMGRMLALVGPSVTLTSVSECCCFFVGALSNMPAVRAFALYAGLSLLLDFIFQITCFVSLLALDSRRCRANRYDFLCCIKSSMPSVPSPSFILLCFKKYIAPAVLHKYVRPIIIIFFYIMFCFSLCSIPVLKLGLSQELSVSKDSYLYSYFTDLNAYLSVGPPVYFIVKNSGLNYSQPNIQNLLCAGTECNDDSLTYEILKASKSPKATFIARPASSWIDDYFDWWSASGCCTMFPNHTFCPRTESSCEECIRGSTNGRPSPTDFKRYISFFLSDNPDSSCPKGGHALYKSLVKISSEGLDNLGFVESSVGANSFMTYHTVLKTSEDYYKALDAALQISDYITNSMNNKISEMGLDIKAEVIPYSIFHVFYEQYLTFKIDAVQGLLLSFLAILITSFVLLGFDIWSAFLLLITIIMTIVNIVGSMYWWNIELNAISLVNVILALGISVEFCSHLTHYFVKTVGTSRLQRVSTSMYNMGSSVFSGITLTKLIGITVLAFAESQLFQVFYFRMFLLIVIYSGLHGLIFLPVLLSYLGSDTHIYYVKNEINE